MSNKTMLILMVLLIYTQAGSCIDGRLTSAWHWCSKIEKKDYYPIFKLAGAPRHPLSARKLGKGGARAAHHPDKNGMRGMHKQKVASRPWCADIGRLRCEMSFNPSCLQAKAGTSLAILR